MMHTPIVVLVALLLVSTGWPWVRIREPQPIRLSVVPRTGLVPMTISVQTIVRRNSLNRKACQQVEGWSESCWTINGADDWAVFHPRRYQITAPGDYDAKAWVEGAGGRVRAITFITVTAR